MMFPAFAAATVAWQGPAGTLWRSDALELLAGIPSHSVELVVTDPPYAIDKEHWDEFESLEAYVEWCDGWLNGDGKTRFARGASWYYTNQGDARSSLRFARDGNISFDRNGFRIVLDLKAPAAKPAASPAAPPAAAPTTRTPPKSDFTNSLGMKFVKVPGTQVIFCIHETRRQDYAAYAAEVPGVNVDWKNQQKDGIPTGHEDNHPVVSVCWEDANAFSAWLSKKEGRKYRLPTDKEWSYAVGIGRDEKWTKDTKPQMLNGKFPNEFPWGGDFPPKTKDAAGNYADTALKEKFPTLPFIEGYTDGFVTTAPVMSFKPNKLGIYDMGGNAWEWVDDWFNAAQQERVLRGASFGNDDRAIMISSNRAHVMPIGRFNNYGFRIVVEMTAP